MTVAFLILKEHSARVPGKNFRTLGDRPLFMWIIHTLLATPEVEGLVIDSDCCRRLRHLGLGRHPRITLVDRDQALLGDDVTADALIAANLDRLGDGPILMTHATTPFLRTETLSAAIQRFEALRRDDEADSLFGASRHQARFWSAQGRPLNHDPKALLPTQQLEPWFEENSTLYLFTAQGFRASGARVGDRPAIFETGRVESVDIDTEADWALAEAIALGLPG